MSKIIRRSGVSLLLFLCVLAGTARAVTISFELADPALGAPGGYFFPGSTEGADRIAALSEVKGYIESTIANPGAITLSLSVYTSPDSLAKGGQFFTSVAPVASGVVFGDAQAEILMGIPVPSANGFLSFNTTKTFYLGADAAGIPSDEHDFRTAALHEITHALGWASFMKPDDKTSALTDFLKDSFPGMYAPLGEIYSMYDTLLVDSMGLTVILPGGAANPLALPIGGASIASPHAIAAHGGELVPTAVIPFIDGDLTHLSSSVMSVMNPTLAAGAIEREWSDVDRAVLADLGYMIVPEPSSLELLAALVMAVAVAMHLRGCAAARMIQRAP
ncbi:MAG: hypothetical protein WD875_12345 [Pirellulales bacterium]